MRKLLLATLLLSPFGLAHAQLSIGLRAPGISIGFNVPSYPQLVLVPGSPVYYDPGLGQNYFYYDGLYWVYMDDTWYSSGWYDGPWDSIRRDDVPLFLLRVPVRYYRRPPIYFRGWSDDAPPRWGDHWGNDWSRQHSGWDHWDRGSVPRAAPPPVYQRDYSGGRYPRTPDQQRAIQGQHGGQRGDAQPRNVAAPRPSATRPMAPNGVAGAARSPADRPAERARPVEQQRPAQQRPAAPSPQETPQRRAAPQQQQQQRPAQQQAPQAQAPERRDTQAPAPAARDSRQGQGNGREQQRPDQPRGNQRGRGNDGEAGQGNDKRDPH